MTRSRSRALTLLAWAGLSLGGCGGDSPTEPPDPNIVASISLGAAPATLVSITETAQLTATARNAAGAPVAAAVIAWASDAPAVATVSASGLVTAVANGTTIVRASTAGFEATATVTVQQLGASIEALEGASQGATVGTALDTNPVFVVKDAAGYVVAATEVTFAVASGAVQPASALTAADGTVGTQWTLGTTAGVQELQAEVAQNPGATVAVPAVALAADPASIELADGDAQSELAEHPLPAPLRVRVRDGYGNAVAGVVVVFSAAAGALDSTDVLTDLDGLAATTWTLGAGLGAHAASAMIPDSAIADGVVITGGPVPFTAEAVAFAVLDAGAIVSGASATVTGSGFAVDPATHVVTVDGVAATITGGTQGSLTFTVPSFGCVPGRPRTIAVTRGAFDGALLRDVAPEGLLDLEPGERVVLGGGASDCLQLPSSTGGDDEYLVGLTSTRRLNAEMPFQLIADDGSGMGALRASSLLPAASLALRTAELAGPTPVPALARHRALREWEARFFSRPRPRRMSRLRQVAPRANAVGDLLALRVPGVLTDACNDYGEVSARVIAMGPRVTVATDATLPVDPASAAAIATVSAALVAQFGDVIHAAATEHFGLPPDVDGDGRVTLLFSPAVVATGVVAFSSAVDAVDRATCPASNEGEVIYVALPAVPSAPDVAAAFAQSAPHLAHELIHVVQSRRIAQGGVALATWLAEGQAELGAEIVAFLSAGLDARSDLDAAALGGVIGAGWLAPRFDRLAALFGWDGAAGRLAGAPERCSLFGFGGLGVPCSEEYALGASWSFMRYVADRIAMAAPAAEAGFLTGLIDGEAATDGTSLLAMLAGASLEDLMVDWAMMLYVDGRLSAQQSSTLQFRSWDLASVFATMPAVKALEPVSRGFGAFADVRSVVGGGTAYTRVSAGGAHGPLALRVRDTSGEPLGTAMQPRLWVVRVR